jgi:E3 ubiquitin-protein ligase RNF19A
MRFYFEGVPVWTGRKMYTRYRHSSRLKRNFAIAGGVLAAVSVFNLLLK